jgi:methyl-accepting chemotaxis protein
MGTFANLRLGTRLAGAFGLLLLLILAVAGMGMYAQRTVSDVTDRITQKDFVKTEIAFQILLTNTQVLAQTTKLLSIADVEEVRKTIDAMAATPSAVNDLYKELEVLVYTPDGKAVLAKLQEARQTYAPLRQQTLALLKAGKRDEAIKQWETQVVPALMAYRKQIEAFLELQKKQVTVGVKEIGAANRSSSVMAGLATALALLLGAGMAFLITRGLLRQLGGEPGFATEVANRIAAGDLSKEVVVKTGDSTSLVASMAKMQRDLKDRLEAERTTAAQNLRIKLALDASASATMIADLDGKIIYANKAQVEMFAKAQEDLRKLFPNFNADDLIGKNIDSFHKNPAHQRNLLASLQGTHRATIPMGPRTFTVVVAPVFGANGERLGAMAGWVDRTVEIGIEKEVAAIIAAASEGDFSKRLGVEDKEGFFRVLAENINRLLETASKGLDEVVRVLGALAKGDLTERITNEYRGTFGRLKDDSNKTVEQLTSIVGSIKESVEAINVAAKEIASGNTDLSQRTEEQASNLEQTAASTEELAGTVKQNAENARQANQLAAGASEVAGRGGEVVRQVVTTMGSISESSKKIVDIISVIDGIAFQTNILALNAAVEAARAGEQGRGFAVVATEVRNLAQRSAAAAKEIKDLIGNSVEKVDTGTKLVDEAGKTMEEIVTSVKRVTDIMSEIMAASQEQSGGIEQVNQAITQMDQVTQQNAALVEEAAAAAESLEEQARVLGETVAVFRMAEGTRGTALPRPAMAKPIPKVTALPVPVGKGAGRPAPRAAPRPAAAPAKAAAGAEDKWEEF